MKTIIRFLLGASALALCWGTTRAAEPADVRTTGRVLLLENERVLEGEVVREGDRYRIRRPLGESWVPAANVLRLCADIDEAYQFLRNRANLRDPDERLRLARWCQLHGLRAHGLEEVQAALQLRPGSAEAARLLRSFQRALTPETPAPVATAAAAETPEPTASAPASADMTLEAVVTFSGKVQPILMNTCASCHVAAKGGSFRLGRAFGDGSLSRRTTQQNMAAVLAQIDVDNWPASPLLVKAVSDHGEVGNLPIKGRQAPAYRTLEDWVQLAAAELRARRPSSAVVQTPLEAPAPTEVVPTGFSTDRNSAAVGGKPQPSGPWNEVPAEEPKAATPKPESPAPAEPNPLPAGIQSTALKPPAPPMPTPVPPTAEVPTGPVDPFDPLIFNRQMHPGRQP